jgi:serine/threonine protein kinase
VLKLKYRQNANFINHPITGKIMIGQILGDRYQILQQMGHDLPRKTFLAMDLQSVTKVVIKLISFNDQMAWPDFKLFEREAKTLKSLNHPFIPRYLDYFDVDLPTIKGFALVQTYIEAKSLEDYVKDGRSFSEEDVKQIAKDILNILIYLQERLPQIHRDIKPSNILISDRSGNSAGEVYLIDFGSVQNYGNKTGTITIVGTYGYMPLEQFGGRTVSASDLYSLGATLIYLLTGTHPADLPQKDGIIQFEQLVNIGQGFKQWLKKMIQPSLDQRFETAKIALESLEKITEIDGNLTLNDRPSGSKIEIRKDFDYLEICIPPYGFSGATIATGTFAIAWNSFIFFWTLGASFAPFPMNVPFLLFSLPFWAAGAFMAYITLFPLFGKIRLTINQETISLVWELFGFKYQQTKPSPREFINKIVYIPHHFDKDSDGDRVEIPPQLLIYAGINKYQLGGTGGGITNETEVQWLAQELSQWLGIEISRE